MKAPSGRRLAANGAGVLSEAEQRVAELAGERAAEVTAKLQLAEIVAALR